MAVARTITVVDGRFILPGEEVPDLGSWIAVGVRGNVRDYEGLSADVDKLPHYVGTGSSARCLDTGDVYKYERSSGAWHKQDRAEDDGGPVTDYSQLGNKPRINGVELSGDISLEQLGIGSAAPGPAIQGLRFSVNDEEGCLQVEYLADGA